MFSFIFFDKKQDLVIMGMCNNLSSWRMRDLYMPYLQLKLQANILRPADLEMNDAY